MGGVICEINWSSFKRAVHDEFIPEIANKVMELIDRHEFVPEEEE